MSIALIAACAGTEPPRIPDSAASLDNATSVSNLEENAEAGKRDAQYELGRRLELGDGIQRDAEGATRWYLAAANQGHLKAMVRLGSLYIRKEARSDQELGLRWLRRGADQGDMDAAKELSYAYLEGRGVEPDPAASTQILTVAAKSGDPQAQFLLGFAYNHGIGVPRDPREAFRWYCQSADREELGRQALGICYYEGFGTTRDLPKAMETLSPLAEKGWAKAQYFLGCCHEADAANPESLKLATKWYRQSAAGGCPDAQIALARLMIPRDSPVHDPVAARSWLTRASASGSLDGDYYLARLAMSGSVVYDASAFLTHLRKAADGGHAVAQYALGVMLATGEGLKRDVAKANEWFQKATNNIEWRSRPGPSQASARTLDSDLEWHMRVAETGLVDAAFLLGVAHGAGDTVLRDNVKAEQWYQRAVAWGHVAAKHGLAMTLMRRGSIDIAKVMLHDNAKNGYARSCYELGMMLSGPEKMDWLQRGAQQRHPACCWSLYSLLAPEGDRNRDTLYSLCSIASHAGIAAAQLELGRALKIGRWGVRDTEQSWRWLERAARQGLSEAQVELAEALWSGDGLVKNDADAYGWCLLALASGSGRARELLDRMEQAMSREEIVDAQKRARSFRVTIEDGAVDPKRE